MLFGLIENNYRHLNQCWYTSGRHYFTTTSTDSGGMKQLYDNRKRWKYLFEHNTGHKSMHTQKKKRNEMHCAWVFYSKSVLGESKFLCIGYVRVCSVIF